MNALTGDSLEERVIDAHRALVLIHATAHNQEGLVSPEDKLEAIAMLSLSAIDVLEPIRHAPGAVGNWHPTGPTQEHLARTLEPSTPVAVREPARNALTLRARLEAAHDCGKPRAGFVQLPRGSGERQWRCGACDAIVMLPQKADEKP